MEHCSIVRQTRMSFYHILDTDPCNLNLLTVAALELCCINRTTTPQCLGRAQQARVVGNADNMAVVEGCVSR